jgi:hypothetical protein
MSGKVVVACKVPNGLILRIGHFVPVFVPVMGGGMKEVQEWRPGEISVTVLGPARPIGGDARVPTAHGYGITYDVDADFWKKWSEDNKDHDALKNHQLYAHEKNEFVVKWCAEHASVKSGLEPIVPDSDTRVPRHVSTATEKKAA